LLRNHTLSVHWRLIVFTITTVILFAIVFSFRTVLLPFIIGLLLAYVLRPVVVCLEEKNPMKPQSREIRRFIVVSVIFIVFSALIALVFLFAASTIINSGPHLLENAASIFESATKTIDNWLLSIRDGMPAFLQTKIDEIITNDGSTFGAAIQGLVDKTVSFVPSTFHFIVGAAELAVFLFYLLLDWEKLSAFLTRGGSPWRIYTRDFVMIVGRIVGRYIRGQLVLGAIVGTFVFVGMTLLGFNPGLAMALGVLSFVMEMVPVFGPWITLAVGVIVTLAFFPQKLLWVIGLHAVIPILEGNFLVPKIQGEVLNIHPALGLFVLVVGSNVAGIWGLVLAFPFTAAVMALYHYFIGSVRVEDHLEAAAGENPVPL
jgi:predicted PurR-regulated permease PerM